MTELTPKGWFEFCMMMEKAGTINQVWISPTTVKDTMYPTDGISFVLIKMMLLKQIFLISTNPRLMDEVSKL